MAAPAALNQNPNQAAPAALPIINGRKTLIIGMGSTGTQVCNQVLERLVWTYGSPDNIPWIRCMTVETAKVDAARLVSVYGNHQHLTIRQDEYAAMLSNPKAFDDTLAFSKWNIPELTGSSDAITDGASNIRLLGRLALLHGRNFTALHATLTRLLQELGQLTEEMASDRYEQANGVAAQVAFAPSVHVYVTGTLCGGTCSGSFIDLAYLLKRMPGVQLNLTGIFTLPSDTEQNTILLGNATAALIELNHFSSDNTRFEAQFPDRPGVPYRTLASGERPYRNLYLAQPRGSSKKEVNQLITTISDYVYADTIGTTAADRDARRTNIANLFNAPDYWGATQKFFTFGMSEIEFPYIKVLKACSVRLTRKGFETLRGEADLTENDLNREMAKILLSKRKALTERLLTTPKGGLRKQFSAVITETVATAANSDEPLDILRSQLKCAFEGNSPAPHKDLGARIVPITIEENAKTALPELLASIQETVRGFLTGPSPLGIQPLMKFLNTLDNELAPKSSGTGEASVSESEQDLTAAQAAVTECRRDLWLKMVGQNGAAVHRYLGEFEETAQTYYSQRLSNACVGEINRIHAEARTLVLVLKHRIAGSERPTAPWAAGLPAKDVCLQSEVNALTGALATEETRLNVKYGGGDAWSRTINGEELFDPATTVNEEYYGCVGAREREASIAAVRPYFQDALAVLFSDLTHTCRFDADPRNQLADVSEPRLLALSQPARGAFAAINERSVIDRLMARPDADTILRNAQDASKLFLDWMAASPRHQDHPNKTYRMVFYNPQSAVAGEFKQRLAAAQILPQQTPPDVIADRHQLIILQERGAFSLGTIGPLDDLKDSFWMYSYTNSEKKILPHTRGDIKEWITWAKSDEDRRKQLRALFLVGCALKKPGETAAIIEFRSATEYVFKYRPLGPYDSGTLLLSDDLVASAREIKNSGMEPQLAGQIARFRTDYGVPEMIGQIVQFIGGSENLFREGDLRLTSKKVTLIVWEYVQSDQELKRAYEGFYNPREAEYQVVDPVTRQVSYACNNCHRVLGSGPESLYVKETVGGMLRERATCVYCGHDFAL